jgi:hypothetical protein
LIDGAIRAPQPGAPFAYVTTRKFLEVFGFATLRDLPDLERLKAEGLLQRGYVEDELDGVLGVMDVEVEESFGDIGEAESVEEFSENPVLRNNIPAQLLRILPILPILPNIGEAMSMAKQAHSARTALTKAIENKVQRMDMLGLTKLATTLKVPVPAAAKTIHARQRKSEGRTSTREGKVLQGAGIGPIVSASEGRKLLDAITVDDHSADWVESDLVGAGELVERLRISRGTLDNWRKAKKIVALRKGLRNFVYPLRQFERRRPVDGLDLVAPFFASPEDTWEWLVAPNRMTSDKPPIEALREGDVALVTSAAEGAFDYA